MTAVKSLSVTRVHGGNLHRFELDSASLRSKTVFAVFVPGPIDADEKFPVLYYLSGLTCTDENVSQKGGAFEHAAKARIAMVMPDTSPRGLDVANDDGWDLGQGAGFYLDATQAPWKEHFHMRTFVTEELPGVVASISELTALDGSRTSITGHSMGGHGALTLALNNPSAYKSVSAFAPISNPTALDCPWGQKAFTTYLGSATDDVAKAHDATELMKAYVGKFPLDILIDQGAADGFYKTQLHPERFVEAAKANGCNVTFRLHDGYDHSYFFVSTFMRDHIEFHAKALHGK